MQLEKILCCTVLIKTTGFRASNAQVISIVLWDWPVASDYMQPNKFITGLTVFDL